MLTKRDFLTAIDNSVQSYPAIAPFYKAGDPHIFQALDAMATMLAMVSSQVDLAMGEVFTKSRDSTILSDAAMRGIILKATPMTVKITATKTGSQSVKILAGRILNDSAGLSYCVTKDVTISSVGPVAILATQIKTVLYNHTVSSDVPFYSIEVPESDDGTFLAALTLRDTVGQNEYTYKQSYVNVLPGERIFHVDVDDNQKVYVVLGFKDMAGIQLSVGTELDIIVSFSAGDAKPPKSGAPFSFYKILGSEDAKISMSLSSIDSAGESPMSISALRDLARYPSVYDKNAVYLGEFDFVIRSNFTKLTFLSVWNERVEEECRGPAVANINTIFVSAKDKNGNNITATTGAEIEKAILAADNSYRVAIIAPVVEVIGMSVTATISNAYNRGEVQAAIENILLLKFGSGSAFSQHGSAILNYRDIHNELTDKVPELSIGRSDLRITFDEAYLTAGNPEVCRYLTLGNLNVEVIVSSVSVPSWGTTR